MKTITINAMEYVTTIQLINETHVDRKTLNKYLSLFNVPAKSFGKVGKIYPITECTNVINFLTERKKNNVNM